LPQGSVDSEGLSKLRELLEHFDGAGGDSDPVSHDTNGTPNMQSARKGRKRSSNDAGNNGGQLKKARPTPQRGFSSENHGPMRRLWKMETLPPVNQMYLRYVQQYGEEPSRFLSDTRDVAPRTRRASEDLGVADTFATCYEWTLKLARQRARENVRWNFVMLMYFDFMDQLFPNSSLIRLGFKMTNKGLSILKTVFGDNSSQLEQAEHNLGRWVKMGRMLAILVENFGEGAIFILNDLLTEPL